MIRRVESLYDDPAKVSFQDLESDYWKLVKNEAGNGVTVEYGNDLSTFEYGSGFPVRQVHSCLIKNP